MTDKPSIRKALTQKLADLQAAGVDCIPTPSREPGRIKLADLGLDQTDPESVGSDEVPSGQSHSQKPNAESTVQLGVNEVASGYGPATPAAERGAQLEIIRNEVAACTKCSELAESRTQTVFGVGNPNARLCFVGEAPGADEDRKGEPFVGAAGQLLDRIINACHMSRDDVFILNTVKCRPPGNRNPSESEIANCWGYGLRQLEIMQPEFICCLGSVAANVVLQKNQSVGKLRKQFHNFRGSRVLVTYHPAYLLRNASAKRQVWEDMKMLMSEMGVDL